MLEIEELRKKAKKKWKVLRYKTLVRYGGVCQCCGSRRPPMHVDHIKPVCTHPELCLDPENLQVLCDDCNLGKGSSDCTDWRWRFEPP